jgi:CheY-like chemotaxis protein
MSKKIVIVEDELIIQALYKEYVEELGHEIIATFESGEEAIVFFQNNTADLILMDIRLEGTLDGIETMKEIQKMNSIPVVYISGNTEERNKERAKSTNMKAFLSKPISKKAIDEIIDTMNELTDSMVYAQKIQEAIFLQREQLQTYFEDSVFINRPKDFISGDFGFLIEKSTGDAVIGGIGDCTGHGIPGALLSVLSYEILVSKSKKHDDLRVIVNELNEKIIENLANIDKKNRISDALDLAIFKVIPKRSIIQIAGIKRVVIYYDSAANEHKILNFKGKSIGEHFSSLDEIPFIEIDYSPNDFFYFFTDGLTDQFGGPDSKKLKRKGLSQFLEKIEGLDCLKREIEIEFFLRNWQGNEEQTDDIFLMGFQPQSCRLNCLSRI